MHSHAQVRRFPLFLKILGPPKGRGGGGGSAPGDVKKAKETLFRLTERKVFECLKVSDGFT